MRIPLNSSAVDSAVSTVANVAKNHSGLFTSINGAIAGQNVTRISSIMPYSEGTSMEMTDPSNATAAANITLKGDVLNEEGDSSLLLFNFDYFVGYRDAYEYYLVNGFSMNNYTNNTTTNDAMQEMADNVRLLAISFAIAFFSFLIIFGTFLYRSSVRIREENEQRHQQRILQECRMRSIRNINLVGRNPQDEIPPADIPVTPIVAAGPPLQMHQLSGCIGQPLLPSQTCSTTNSNGQMAVVVVERELAAVQRVQLNLPRMEKAAENVVIFRQSASQQEKQYHARHVAEGRVEPVCVVCNERIQEDDGKDFKY